MVSNSNSPWRKDMGKFFKKEDHPILGFCIKCPEAIYGKDTKGVPYKYCRRHMPKYRRSNQ